MLAEENDKLRTKKETMKNAEKAQGKFIQVEFQNCAQNRKKAPVIGNFKKRRRQILKDSIKFVVGNELCCAPGCAGPDDMFGRDKMPMEGRALRYSGTVHGNCGSTLSEAA
jgi:hypothetical protein